MRGWRRSWRSGIELGSHQVAEKTPETTGFRRFFCDTTRVENETCGEYAEFGVEPASTAVVCR
jgi:hypothetical protein